jgi:diaminohydroxyphosphoribosylaminopyrimidine deaminase/5-amino-6-(5-phosphoribosylamino)uracil reductase
MPEASGKFSRQDRAYMARALKLALGGRYSTRPNPRVGCVLVNDGRITRKRRP